MALVTSSATTSPPEYAYDAFASHATDPDGALVRLVEALVESYHRRRGLPPEYVRELQLCVDGRDFAFPRRQRGDSTADEIEPIVRAYERRSRSLLVFSGSLSREHPWIGREIKWWLEERPDGPIYFALTHAADPAVRETYLPPALIEHGSSNAIYFDLRGYYQERGRRFRYLGALLLSRNEARLEQEAREWKSVRPFAEEVTKLAAQLVSDATGSSIPVSELEAAYAEVERREARRRLYVRAVVGVVLAGLIGLLIWTTLAFFTELGRRTRTSWQQQATVLSSSPGPQLLDALAYAASAVRDGSDPGSIAALYTILPRIAPVERTIRPILGERASEQTQVASLLENGAGLASGGRDGTIYFSDTATSELLASLVLNCGRIRTIVPLASGRSVAIASDRGLRLVSIAVIDGRPTLTDEETILSGRRIGSVAVAPDGTLFAGELMSGTLWRLDPLPSERPLQFDSHLLGTIIDPRYPEDDVPSSVFGLAIRDNDLIVAGIDGVLTVFDISEPTVALPPVQYQIVHPASIFALDVTLDGTSIGIADDEGNVYLYDSDLANPRMVPLQTQDPASVSQRVDKSWTAASVDQVPAVGIGFSPSGDIVGATGHDRTVKFFLSDNLRLIATDIHAAATRGVVFADDGATAYTFGDDGIVNVVHPLASGPSIRIGDVVSFVPTAADSRIAFWVDDPDGAGTIFAIRPDESPPGTKLGPIGEGGGWGGVAFGPESILVRRSSTFVPQYPLASGKGGACPDGGLQHPNEVDNVEMVLRLLQGPSAGEVVTITRPNNDGPSHLRVWRSAECTTQWQLDYSGTAEAASISAGVVATIEDKRVARLRYPSGAANQIDEILFPRELAALAVAPRGDRIAVVPSERTSYCMCVRSPPGQTNGCGADATAFKCEEIAAPAAAFNNQIAFSASGHSLVLGYGVAGLALASAEDGWSPKVIGPQQVRAVTTPFAFSPDESMLAVPAGDAGIAVFDPVSRTINALLPTPSRVMQLDFLRDGTDRLISLDGGVLRTWDWRKDLLLQQACSRWPIWFKGPTSSAVPAPLSRDAVCTAR